MSEQKDLETFPSVIERKHVIKRYRREIDGKEFLVAEVWAPKAPGPKLVVMRPAGPDTLEGVTARAKRVVRLLIEHGGRLPADQFGTDVSFNSSGIDAYNARSSSGKRQWCEKHWRPLADGTMSGTHNILIAGIYLTTAFMEKIKSDGALRADQNNPYTVEMLRDSYSPFCCWLGDEIVQRIMDACTVEALEKSGALRELEKQLRKQ